MRASVPERIESQLDQGRRLLELPIHTLKDLERATARRSVWVEDNVNLLKESPLPDKVKTKIVSQVSLNDTRTGEDFSAEVESFRDITKTQMSMLESALALTFNNASEPARGTETGAAGYAAATSPPAIAAIDSRAAGHASFKENLERHPTWVAAAICVASITLVFAVMTWYHGESEKTLINRYEMQINGLKNDLDAERRSHEETRRKLDDELTKAKASADKIR